MRRGRDGLEKQMVEAEGEVEGRIAVPGAFRVEKDRPGGADQDVLRADIAMDKGDARGEPSPRRAPRAGREVRMALGGGVEIGVEPDRPEDVSGVEVSGDRPRRRRGMERGDARPTAPAKAGSISAGRSRPSRPGRRPAADSPWRRGPLRGPGRGSRRRGRRTARRGLRSQATSEALRSTAARASRPRPELGQRPLDDEAAAALPRPARYRRRRRRSADGIAPVPPA